MYKNTEIMEQFTKAYDELSDAIFRHCWFRIGDRERAKDLMQETFTKSWQYISRGEKVDNLKAFLYRVANNLIIDEYRKKKELSLDNLMVEGFEPGFDDRRKNEQEIDANVFFWWCLLHCVNILYCLAALLFQKKSKMGNMFLLILHIKY